MAILKKVDPVLASVIHQAEKAWMLLSDYNCGRRIRVVSGLRTAEEQMELYRRGKTRTTHSAHMEGLAVDIAIINGKRYEENFQFYRLFNKQVQRCAKEFNAIIGWGGDWISLRDGPHFYIVDREPFLTVPIALDLAAQSPAKDGGVR